MVGECWSNVYDWKVSFVDLASMKATILIATIHRCMALEHVKVVNTGYYEGIILKVIPYRLLAFFFSFLRDKSIMCIS